MNMVNNHQDKHGYTVWAAELKETGELIGSIGLYSIDWESHFTPVIEVMWRLGSEQWGKGYATEALNALLNWAKKNISRQYIIAFAPTQHVASQRLMEKCSMTLYKTDIAHRVECKFYKIIIKN